MTGLDYLALALGLLAANIGLAVVYYLVFYQTPPEE